MIGRKDTENWNKLNDNNKYDDDYDAGSNEYGEDDMKKMTKNATTPESHNRY